MDELISRQDVLDAIDKYILGKEEDETCEVRELLRLITKIYHMPSARPEIIYCKDCKWKRGSECVRFADVRLFPDDFCSRAERRTDE